MKDKIVKLKNGGTLIYSHTNLNNCSAVEIGFSVGAECDKKLGTAHFLEHTLFKKTKNRTNEEVERDRNKIANLNAATGSDYIVVKFFRTNKLINESLDFAYDILMNSVIDKEYIESEKGVIKEELKMTLDNESRDIYMFNLCQAISKPKFSSDILGKTETNIDSIKFSDLQKFKEKYFVGNNFVCSIVSSLSLFKVKKLINKYFVTKIPYQKDYVCPKTHYEKVNVDQKSSLKIVQQTNEKVSVLLSFKIGANEEDIFGKNYNYLFLARYLSGSQGKLFLKLRNKGLIYRMSADITSFKNSSLFNIFFETSKEKIVDAIDIIKDEIKDIIFNNIDDKLIEEYKKNLDYFADEKMPEKLARKCHMNLMDKISYNKLFRISKKQKKILRNGINAEEIQKVVNKIFNKNNHMYVTVLGNVVKKNVPTYKYFVENFLISE